MHESRNFLLEISLGIKPQVIYTTYSRFRISVFEDFYAHDKLWGQDKYQSYVCHKLNLVIMSMTGTSGICT